MAMQNRVNQKKGNAENNGPTISDNVTKALEECVRTMMSNLPPSTVQKNKTRIKRPMNAFMVYSQTARKAMARHYPTLSYRKLSKALGKIWRVLDDEEKKPFKREAERLRQKHKQDYPDYKFKPIKTRKVRAQVAPVKQSVPTAKDLMKIITAGCDAKQSCQGVPSTFNQVPSPLEGNSFIETTTMEQHPGCFASSPLNVQAASPENFQCNENLQLEEDLFSLLENVLNGSQDLFQHELPSTPLPTVSQFQPTNHYRAGHFTVNRNGPSSFPVAQPMSQTNNLPQGNESGPLFELLNGNEQSCGIFGRSGKFLGDFENFCELMTNDKLISPVSPTPQNDFSDSSSVFLNL